MAIHSVVLERTLGANNEGDVVQCDEELAQSMIAAGIAREATEEDLAGAGEDEAPEELDADEETPELVEEQVAAVRRSVEAEAKKTATEEVKKLVKASAPKLPNLKGRVPENRHVAGSDEFRTGGFKSMGDFATNCFRVLKGNWSAAKKINRHKELMGAHLKATGMSISGGSGHEGGDLVPQQWAEEIWRLTFKNTPDLLGMCRRWDSVVQKFEIPVWVKTSQTAGITAAVVAEATQITPTKGVTATVELAMKKEACLVNVSDELLRFNPYHLDNVIMQTVPDYFRFHINDDVINGTNGGVNLVGNAAAKVVLRTKNSRFSYADVLNMNAGLLDESEDDAFWLCNKSSLPELWALAYPDNDASVKVPALSSGGYGELLGAKPKFILHGKPVFTSDNAPAMTAKGGLILTSFNAIGAAYTGLISDRTPYLYFDYAQDSFRFMLYHDTANQLTSVYTAPDNSTRSNIVVLSATTSS